MAKTHYIAMAGIHGCIPNYCSVYADYKDAVGSLADLHELGKKRTAALRKDSYLELNLARDGNEYAEISDCDCSNPFEHQDYEWNEEQWYEENPEFNRQ